MNNVNLTGRLTADPELIPTKTGTPLVVLRVVIFRPGRTRVVFCDVRTFGKQALLCAANFRKGQLIGVAGRLEFEEWTAKLGGRRSLLYVIGERIYDADASAGGSTPAEPVTA